jgi:predicted  nucleic acid-binding Zn-ribbon protein
MTKRVSLAQLGGFITQNMDRIQAVCQEAEELQVGLNGKYVEFKARHDAALASLVNQIADDPEIAGPELGRMIADRIVEERAGVEARRRDLREELLPAAQKEADDLLATAQAEVEHYRKVNPQFDQSEEQVKARRVELQRQLEELNQQVQKFGRGFGFLTNFGKISKLDRERQRIIGQLQYAERELKEIRDKWDAKQTEFTSRQEEAKARWQEASIELSKLQGELELLDDDPARERLVLQRAARHVVDNLKERVTCPDADFQQKLDEMVELNINTDNYHEGLGKAAGLIALLNAVHQGLGSMQESVGALVREQRMHSAYLPKLQVEIPDEAVVFHRQWDDLKAMVVDEKAVCEHPLDFVKAMEPVVEKQLSDPAINDMFESLGGALSRAADEQWK